MPDYVRSLYSRSCYGMIYQSLILREFPFAAGRGPAARLSSPLAAREFWRVGVPGLAFTGRGRTKTARILKLILCLNDIYMLFVCFTTENSVRM